MLPNPPERRRGILHLSEEVGFRSGTVAYGKHGKSLLGKVRAEIAVEVLVTVNESATMNVDVHRSGFAAPDHTVVRQVQVEPVGAGSVVYVLDVGDDVDSFMIMPVVGSRDVSLENSSRDSSTCSARTGSTSARSSSSTVHLGNI